MSSQDRITEFPISLRDTFDRSRSNQDTDLAVQLHAALAREQILLEEMQQHVQRQRVLAVEFEHRLINGLQLVVSLLSLQSRTATTPEAVSQLNIAARRVASLGRVHRRLHLLDHQDTVEFKEYLERLCEDLSGLLLQESSGCAIVVEGPKIEIPTAMAIPLGFIVNELITNSAKYAEGHVTVRLDRVFPIDRSLSVIDDGPGLPDGFQPSDSKGLGMKIILSLIKQISGRFEILPGRNGRGTNFRISF